MRGHVHHAEIAFDAGADTRAPGGAVTVALCGSWDHEGSCRWPHHTSVDEATAPAAVRVVYVVGDDELDHVRTLIDSALTAGDGWRAIATWPDQLTANERAHADRLRANHHS